MDAAVQTFLGKYAKEYQSLREGASADEAARAACMRIVVQLPKLPFGIRTKAGGAKAEDVVIDAPPKPTDDCQASLNAVAQWFVDAYVKAFKARRPGLD